MTDPTYNIPENPIYDPEIRKFQNSDPVNAETVINPVIGRIVENVHAVKTQGDNAAKDIEKLKEDVKDAGSSADLDAHKDNKENPHNVTAAQAGAIPSSEKAAAGGVASLGEDGKVPAGQLPEMDYDPKGSASGVEQKLDLHKGDKGNPHGVTVTQIGAIASSEKGAAGGVASLGADGKVPGTQLPQMDYDPKGSAGAVQSNLNAHTGSKANPHEVTKSQVGLGNVDNTSDANKPVSTAQKAAIDAVETKANNAQTTANEAKTTAGAAQTTANEAKSIASSLQDEIAKGYIEKTQVIASSSTFVTPVKGEYIITAIGKGGSGGATAGSGSSSAAGAGGGAGGVAQSILQLNSGVKCTITINDEYSQFTGPASITANAGGNGANGNTASSGSAYGGTGGTAKGGNIFNFSGESGETVKSRASEAGNGGSVGLSSHLSAGGKRGGNTAGDGGYGYNPYNNTAKLSAGGKGAYLVCNGDTTTYGKEGVLGGGDGGRVRGSSSSSVQGKDGCGGGGGGGYGGGGGGGYSVYIGAWGGEGGDGAVIIEYLQPLS